MTRIVLALAFGLGLSIVGCSADGASTDDTLPTTDPPSSQKKASSSSSSSSSGSASNDDGHYTTPDAPADPVTPTTPTDPSKPTDPSTPTTPTTPDPNAPATPGTPQTKVCTATNGSNKSVTTVTFAVDSNAALTVSKMTVEMTNKDNRDKNDVDVYITPQGGSEKKSFNSGDILPHGKSTEVPLPTSFNVSMGGKIRISTNFDSPLLDPSASCTIQF